MVVKITHSLYVNPEHVVGVAICGSQMDHIMVSLSTGESHRVNIGYRESVYETFDALVKRINGGD